MRLFEGALAAGRNQLGARPRAPRTSDWENMSTRGREDRFLNRRSQRGIAATTAGYRIGVSAYGRTGENDVVKPQPPERNPRENARSPMRVEQRSQREERVDHVETRALCNPGKSFNFGEIFVQLVENA